MQEPSGTQVYGYDPNGNITAITTSAGTTTYAYSGTGADATNELTSVIAPSQPITGYGYDAMGDTTNITDTAGANIGLGYDKQERLIGVTLTDGTQVSMAYNAQGQRASYSVSKGGTTSLSEVFTYRNGALGRAVVTGASVTTPYTDTYLYAPDGNPLELLRQQSGTTSRYWYVLDGRANVVALTSVTGTVVDRYSYDAWGQPIATQTSETVPQPFRYAGYWYDKELGWYWVSVREYSPQIGRWLQPDPSGQDGVRTYVYVGDDPVDATDPSGLASRGSDASCNTFIVGFFCARNQRERQANSRSIAQQQLLAATVFFYRGIKPGTKISDIWALKGTEIDNIEAGKTGYGVSVFDRASALGHPYNQRYARVRLSSFTRLRIERRGNNPYHYEIKPNYPMSVSEYETALQEDVEIVAVYGGGGSDESGSDEAPPPDEGVPPPAGGE